MPFVSDGAATAKAQPQTRALYLEEAMNLKHHWQDVLFYGLLIVCMGYFVYHILAAVLR